MAEDKRSFVAAIRSTALRRAAMVVVLPFHLRLLVPAFFLTLYSSAHVAAEAFSDHMRWEWSHRHFRALKLGLKQMWSKEWNPDR